MEKQLTRTIRIWIKIFMISLILSGATAFFVETGLSVILRYVDTGTLLGDWLHKAHDGVRITNARYPFIAYGSDWLAFGHIVIALFFIGPLKDPIINKWVLKVGLIACLGIFPLAAIAGHFRSIPIFWQLIDCSFAVIGGGLLIYVLRKIEILEIEVMKRRIDDQINSTLNKQLQ